MKEKILKEIDSRIKSIERNQRIGGGGYYKVELTGQKNSLTYLQNWIKKLK